MVGVAGKSQACHTCKRRRVKCDLRWPTCFRCEKGKFTCAGYERGPVFINRTPTQLSVTAASVISEARHKDNKNIIVPIFEEDLRYLISEVTNPGSPSYHPVAFRRSAVKLLKKLYLPQQPLETYRHPIGSACTWLDSLDILTEESRALDLAILALCVVQTRLTNTSFLSLEEGLQFYSEALRHHRTDLQDEQKRSRDESLAVIVVLTTCEIFGSQFEESWRVHALAIPEILRLRDQSGPRTQTWHGLCCRLRMVCMIDGLTKQQPLFLTSSDWLYASKNIYHQPVDHLLDIVTTLPASLSQYNVLIGDPHQEQRDDQMASILNNLIRVVNQINSWQHQINVGLSRALYWAVPSQLHNPADDNYPTKRFPFALEFDSLDSAIMLSFAWSMKLQILNKIIHIPRWFHDNPTYLPSLHEILGRDEEQLDLRDTSTGQSYYNPPDNVSLSLVKAEADKLGRLLCQSIGYCYRTEMGTLGPQCCRYPQWVIRQFFGQNPGYERELGWALQMNNLTGPGLHMKLDLLEFQDSI